MAYTGIELGAEGLRVGALVRNSDLAAHPEVVASFPALSQALLSGASPQIRNMATVGGNLLQRTRCSYFRDVAVDACNKRKPGSGCAALSGYSRMHAVLGVSDQCIAANPSDMSVRAVGTSTPSFTHAAPHGDGRCHSPTSIRCQGNRPEIESALEQAEIVTYISIPKSELAKRSAYVKARDRASFAFALASAAAGWELEGNLIRKARVALGGVASKPCAVRRSSRRCSASRPRQIVYRRRRARHA
ncbi:MAG: FAD binding domain-containing protein [Pseudomonadota bacterium]